MVISVKKEENTEKSQNVIFKKSQNLLASRAWYKPQTKANNIVVTYSTIENEYKAIECSE